jgi:hypothetical protein
MKMTRIGNRKEELRPVQYDSLQNVIIIRILKFSRLLTIIYVLAEIQLSIGLPRTR